MPSSSKAGHFLVVVVVHGVGWFCPVPGRRFFWKFLHFSDAMQYLLCFMVEFNAIDHGFASLECFFDSLWHFWSCKDSGIWCLWLVIFACISFAVLAFDFVKNPWNLRLLVRSRLAYFLEYPVVSHTSSSMRILLSNLASAYALRFTPMYSFVAFRGIFMPHIISRVSNIWRMGSPKT